MTESFFTSGAGLPTPLLAALADLPGFTGPTPWYENPFIVLFVAAFLVELVRCLR